VTPFPVDTVAAHLPAALRRFQWWLVALIVALDQATKAWVVRALPLHDGFTVIPGVFDVTHVRNTGAAFGMLNAIDFPYKSVVLTAVALVALLAIGAYTSRFASESTLARAGVVLVISGAIGNLIDRARLGYVVDFVDLYWRGWHFWAFNVADAAITVGAVALALDILFSGRRHVPEAV
jgi:signal peptidase II